MEEGFFVKTRRQLPFPAICAILAISEDIPRYCASSVSSGQAVSTGAASSGDQQRI